MNIAQEVVTAGLVVVSGRPGIGRTVGVESIETKLTGTSRAQEGSPDLNEIVIPARAVAYIERSGRVWLLADGPVGEADVAVVYVAAYRDGDVNEEQTEALAVVEAVLGAAYGLDDPASTDQGDPE